MAGDVNSSNRARVRTWLQKLTTSDHLVFSGHDELKMLLDLYDTNPLHPIQYYFDNRFKGRLPVPDESLCTTASASEHVDRNRTRENYPTDEGLLKTEDGTFINASIIEGKDRTYIATQHPLPSTVLDFWKMVLEEKPAIVIMLNKYEFDKPIKNPNEPELVQYWPGSSKSGFIDSILLEDKDSGGTVKISVLPEPPNVEFEELDSSTTNPNHGINSTKDSNQPKHKRTRESKLDNTQSDIPTNFSNDVNTITDEGDTEANTFTGKRQHISNTDKNGNRLRGVNGHQEYKLSPNIEYSRLLVEYQGKNHQLWHIRCGGWADQEAPDLDLFMDLWHLVQEKLKTHKVKHGEKHKIVIHCTGGVGRTGTFIAVDIAGQEMKEKRETGKWDEFSIEKVIHFLRKKRMNMVGSVSQYIFCHRAALTLFGGRLPEDNKPP